MFGKRCQFGVRWSNRLTCSEVACESAESSDAGLVRTRVLTRELVETKVGSESPTRKNLVPREPKRLQILLFGQVTEVSFCWMYSASNDSLMWKTRSSSHRELGSHVLVGPSS